MKRKLKRIIIESFSWILPSLIFFFVLVVQLERIQNNQEASTLTDTSKEIFSIASLREYILFIQRPGLCYYPIQKTILLIFCFLSYMIILVIFLKKLLKKKKISYDNLSVLLFPFIFYMLYSTNISVISYFLSMYIFILVLVPIAFVTSYVFSINLNSLSKKTATYKVTKVSQILSTIVFIFVGLINVLLLLRMNIHVRYLSVVKDADIEAFNWIEKNIDSDKYILPANIGGFGNNQNFIFDSLLYLRAFTTREEVLGFVQGNKINDNENLRKLYLELSNNVGNEATIKKLLDNNIIYIFDGSYKPWEEGYINSAEFEKYPDNYVKIYSRNDVEIYQIILRDNDI